MSEMEQQQLEIELEQCDLIAQLVSSTSTHPELVGDENEEVTEEPVNGCDSTTEVNETSFEPATNQDITVESTSQESDDGANTLDSTDKTETSSVGDAQKPEEPPPPPASESPNLNDNETNTPKTSRELKSILALSKEAKLDTNISTHRRKTLDKVKGTPKKNTKITNFPVTAESELENFDAKVEEKADKKVAKKRKTSLSENSAEGATGDEIRRNLHDISDDFIMLKKPNKDIFCWRCHHSGVQIACETCPRAYHLKCLKQTITDMEHWPCPECVAILKAENTQTRSKAMKGMSLEHLCSLLKFACKRMMQCTGSEPFIHSVDEKQFPEYRNYIIQPMTLTMLDKNIKENAYGSTQAFEADAKWILHNSIIFNSYQSKLTTAAKTIVKICKQEMAEIENCPSCYLNANTKKHTWFVEVCPKPHLLVWAKLKGFPYWPAKVMSINSSGMADVRFFGAHDKAWVSVKDCYLYSVKDPNSGKQKRNDIIECVKELELYVENLKEIYGRVNLAPFKTPLEPDSRLKQLQVFLPNYKGETQEVIKKVKDAGKGDGRNWEKNVNIENEVDDASDKSSANENDDVEEEQEDKTIRKTKDNDVDMEKNVSCHIVKQGSMTRIDYRESPPDKPKLVAKPIKAILIRKRYSSDDVRDNASSKIARRSLTKSEPVRLPLDNSIKPRENKEPKNKTEDDKNKLATSPQPKIKITDQLIKKLEDLNENEDTKSSKSEKKSDAKEENEKDISLVKDTDKQEQTNEIVEEGSKDEEDEKTLAEIKEKDDTENKKVDESSESAKNLIDSEKPEEATEAVPNLEINATDIRNIIHSSLNTSETNVSKSTEAEIGKKRKHEESKETNKEESNLFPPNKMVKLVPIENILQKKSDNENKSNKTEQLIVLKEIRVVKDGKEIKNSSSNKSNNLDKTKEGAVEIKNEVESDEDNSDVQYMEAKRQYLSALNISEKQKGPIKPKAHEIRTRSKTEEKKSKSAENLSKAADNVATSKAPTEPIKEIYIKSLSKMQTPKHKARKSFPTPNYSKKTIVARKLVPKASVDDELTIVNAATLQPTGNVMILPKLHYNKPSPINRDLSSPPLLTMLPRPPVETPAAKKVVEGSQNYIPQNEEENRSGGSGILLNNLLTNTSATTPPIIDVDSHSSQIDTDLGTLKEILPESLAKGVNELLCQPPPKLKPKPLGILNSSTDSGVPSTAGPVASKINAMAQKLGDFFRGLLVETINDLGKSDNQEATISSLKYEVEELNHKHSIELSEIRRNVSIVLKDIQKSVVEERERIINETKANCEMEMTKKVEEAKSKQWCANCLKEAQFYCCWNTSYCDYPCQQKHWLKHMSKCTQTTNQNQTATTPVRQPGQQLVLTSTAGPKFGALFAKPQKVYLKRANTSFKQPPGSHITLVESTPGNFELLGSGPIAVNGKILASTSVIEKFKSSNIVTVTAPSNSANTQLASANQKVNPVSKSTASSSDREH